MMHSIYYNWNGPEEIRRQRLYEGQLFVYSPNPAMMKLVDHARKMIEDAFHPVEPRKAQYSMPVEEYVRICTPLKPGFIHHPETKKILQQVVSEYGCGLEKTYIDVPRLRMVTSDGYLTSGVGYAHHPHRDTWYSAPMMQINWWVPSTTSRLSNRWRFTRNTSTSPSRTGRRRSTTSGTPSAARTQGR